MTIFEMLEEKGQKMNKKRLQPLDDQVIILREDALQKTEGGLYIPDSAKKKPLKGKVIAIGDDPGVNEVLKIGDVIWYEPFEGTDVDFDGRDYVILHRGEILCKEVEE